MLGFAIQTKDAAALVPEGPLNAPRLLRYHWYTKLICSNL